MTRKSEAAAMSAVMRDAAPLQSADKLDRLRAKVREARDLELLIEETEEKLKSLRSSLQDILGGGQKAGELVDLFEAARSPGMSLDAEGNVPAYDARVRPFYSASIPKDPERAAVALDVIEREWKMPDLIKTEYSISFGMGERRRARKLESLLKKNEFADYESRVGVHASTLRAEIRRRYESGSPLSPSELEKVGGYVGKVVELKRRKTD